MLNFMSNCVFYFGLWLWTCFFFWVLRFCIYWEEKYHAHRELLVNNFKNSIKSLIKTLSKNKNFFWKSNQNRIPYPFVYIFQCIYYDGRIENKWLSCNMTVTFTVFCLASPLLQSVDKILINIEHSATKNPQNVTTLTMWKAIFTLANKRDRGRAA